MFERILKSKREAQEKERGLPKHIAITMNGNLTWSLKHGKPLPDAYRKGFDVVNSVIQAQTELGIPVLTFHILPERLIDLKEFPIFMELLIEFLAELKSNKTIKNNQVKVSVLGKWYELPGRLIEPIKDILDETKEYDRFFLNMCINYSGHEEIVDACRLIARKVAAEKLHPDAINRDVVKENLYCSFFVPPDLIICTGSSRELEGLLLWDSAHSVIHQSERLWPDFTQADFEKAIDEYKKI